MNDLTQLNIEDIHNRLLNKEFSVKELLDFYLNNIKAMEPVISSFITLVEDEAIQKANQIDDKIKKGKDISLVAGIPYSAKDIIMTKGINTTAGSNILKNFKAPYDASVIKNLNKNDAILVGKTNLDAFGHGVSTENSDFFITKNPWDNTRIAGGSSGGSATSVAANQNVFSLGTDTGGSIRCPANYCGVVGLKPTYGLVSRYGYLSMQSSSDCLGLITKNVKDCATVLDYIAGNDPKDASQPDLKKVNYLKSLKPESVKNLKIGVVKEFMQHPKLNTGVKGCLLKAMQKFKDLGCEIIEVSLPNINYAVAAYYILMPSEVSSNLTRYDGIKYGYSVINENDFDQYDNVYQIYLKTRKKGFGPEAKRRIMIGTYCLSAGSFNDFYLKAAKIRTLIIKDFSETFNKVECILGPVNPTPAFRIGEKKTPLESYVEDCFSIPPSLAGLPALSVPCGFSIFEKTNLPVGMQLIGNHFTEDKILNLGYNYELSLKK